MTTTKERPILFTPDNAGAVHRGDKTHTRRVITPQPHAGIRSSVLTKSGWEDGHGREIKCPYGQVGDRLWVREAWAEVSFAMTHACGAGGCDSFITAGHTDRGKVFYRADDSHHEAFKYLRWRSSIHMPRRASRTTLEITEIRVERVQDISEEDAKAEGAAPFCKYRLDGVPVNRHCSTDCDPNHYRYGFHRLWDSINLKRKGGAYSWARNPWVWVVAFKKVTP